MDDPTTARGEITAVQVLWDELAVLYSPVPIIEEKTAQPFPEKETYSLDVPAKETAVVPVKEAAAVLVKETATVPAKETAVAPAKETAAASGQEDEGGTPSAAKPDAPEPAESGPMPAAPVPEMDTSQYFDEKESPSEQNS
jgi:hypothetical protein